MENELQEARKKLHLTQREVAEKVGITARAYQRYEYGEREPGVCVAIRIAYALMTTVPELWGDLIVDNK